MGLALGSTLLSGAAFGDIEVKGIDYGSVQVFRSGPSPIPAPPATISLSFSPTSMAVDQTGVMYVGDGNGKVHKIVPGSSPAQVSGITGIAYPNGMAIDSDGTLYIADGDNNKVIKYTSSGVQSTVSFTSLNGVNDVTVDSDKSVYVVNAVNGNVFKKTSAGTQSTVAFTGLVQSYYIDVDTAGTVYVKGFTKSAGMISRRTAAGVQTNFDLGNVNFVGMAVDSSGNMYHMNTTTAVQKITPSGTKSTVSLSGLGNGSYIAIDRSDNLYVCDSDNNKILTKAAGTY